jgi:hypothetical protein
MYVDCVHKRRLKDGYLSQDLWPSHSKRRTARSVWLRCWPGRVFTIVRLLRLAGFKPGRYLRGWDCPSRQMRVHSAGGDDQSFIEFGSREFPGFHFGIKRFG